MSSTEKLYWKDPYARAFEGQVVDVTPADDGEHWVVLRETAFYPEAGGQRADAGTLGGLPVLHVEESGGVIRHRVRGVAPEKGRALEGAIEWTRRFDMMQHHTSQHVLSAGLHELVKAPTVSARLGERGCTIDLSDVTELSAAAISEVEDRVNGIIWEDRPVRALMPTADELGRMKLRRAPKVDDGVRVIEVEGFDLSPCGGTHVRRTGELGCIRILKTERYKGGVRVEFGAGARALRDARERMSIIERLSSLLTAGAPEIPAAIDKLQAALKEQTRARSDLWGELVGHLAKGFAAEATPRGDGRVLVAELKGRSRAEARTLALRLVHDDPKLACALLVDDEGRAQLVVTAGASSGVNAGAVVKQATTLVGGRGGGKAELAEGAGAAGVEVGKLLDAVRSAIGSV